MCQKYFAHWSLTKLFLNRIRWYVTIGMPCSFILDHTSLTELLCFALGALLPQVQCDNFWWILVQCSCHYYWHLILWCLTVTTGYRQTLPLYLFQCSLHISYALAKGIIYFILNPWYWTLDQGCIFYSWENCVFLTDGWCFHLRSALSLLSSWVLVVRVLTW